MKNYDFRIKKLEKMLIQKNKTVILINYITSEPESFIKINGQKYLILDGANVKKIIAEKISGFSGVVTCPVYLAKNLSQNYVQEEFTSKQDTMIKVNG